MVGIILLALAGMALLAKALHSKTAFVTLSALILVVPFLMVANIISIIGGIFLTTIVTIGVLWLDDQGILA